MLLYCLMRRRNTESINPKVSKKTNGKAIICQHVLYVVVKNQNLLNNKEQKDY